MKPSNKELESATAWVAEHLLSVDAAALPFAFRCGEQSSQEWLSACTRTCESRELDAERVEHTLIFTDAAGLELRCVGIEYRDFPAVEWVLHFKNGNTENSPILSDIQALDTVVEPESAPWGTRFTVHHSRGALASPEDFDPRARVLNPKASFSVQPGGGRSSSEYLPYFNLAIGQTGVVVAIGWTGEWAFRAARDDNNRVRIQAGMAHTRFTLYPGEEVRSPRILIVFWEGERLRGHNLLRSLILDHYRPVADGKPVGGLLLTNTWGTMRADQHLDNISQIAKYEMPVEYYWIDAEWFGAKIPWWEQNGNWAPNPALYPEGLKPIGDACHRTGKKFLLWFEEERVCPGTPIWEEHPEYLLLIDEKDECWSWPEWCDMDDPEWYPAESGRNRIAGGEGLFNLGDPEARQYMTDLISDRITAYGIDVFRQDFNIAPLAFWRANDAKLSPEKQDRQGITEIRYVEGMYAFLDELMRRHPGLIIDSCASGGRRLDLEMIRRTVTLTHSDSAHNIIAQQCEGYGIRLWVPLAWTFRGDICQSDYELRSMMGVHLCANMTDRKIAPEWKTPETPRPMSDHLPFDALRQKLEQYLEIRHLFLGDFYPLTEFSRTQDAWMVCQHDCPEQGEGLIVALKRPASPFATADFALRGLDAEAEYEVTNLDTKEIGCFTGAALMERGLTVHLPAKPDSALIVYRRLQ